MNRYFILCLAAYLYSSSYVCCMFVLCLCTLVYACGLVYVLYGKHTRTTFRRTRGSNSNAKGKKKVPTTTSPVLEGQRSESLKAINFAGLLPASLEGSFYRCIYYTFVNNYFLISSSIYQSVIKDE